MYCRDSKKIGTTVLSTSRWFDYQIELPTATTTEVFDKDTSVLTLTDTSTYKIGFTHTALSNGATPNPIPDPSTGGFTVSSIRERVKITQVCTEVYYSLNPARFTG